MHPNVSNFFLSEYRYYPALTIPLGSTDISVHETTPSQSNFLAFKGSETLDFINGHLTVLPLGIASKPFAGNIWTYEQPGNGAESIHTDGPIDEDVTVYILANQTHDGINFTFNLPKADLEDLTRPVYFWNSTEWGQCDALCGRGHQERGVACWKLRPGGIVTEEDGGAECGSLTKPVPRRECSMELCRYKWTSMEWGQCNVSCGEGVRTREVKCEWIREEFGLPNVQTDDHLCPTGEMPEAMDACELGACRYEWGRGEWGRCDAVCGEGRQEREVWCQKEGRKGEEVSETLCTMEKPSTAELCHAPDPCSNFNWLSSSWSEVRV